MSGRIRNRNGSREATTHALRETKAQVYRKANARAKREVSMSNVVVNQFVVPETSRRGTGEKNRRLYPAKTKKVVEEVSKRGTGEKSEWLYPAETKKVVG